MSDNEQKKSEIAQKEEQILKFWQDNKIFAKSVDREAPKGDFTFYDGPPFATGTPHYGHLIGGTIKDAIPRYQTMRGYRVRRRWGWDCHGLPIENLIEKELNLKTKKDIIDYGIENFNDQARASVLRYADEWQKIVPRLGRFVDMDDDYRTMDASYSETTWWIFKQLYDRGLVYEGYKSMHICPRCETTLSNFEVSQGYKDITDISLIAKFELINDSPSIDSTGSPQANSGQARTYVLAWTTTPWTLPGNVALAINPKIKYVKIKIGEENYILAKDRLVAVLKNETYEVVEEFDGKKLIGGKYKPLFDYYQNDTKLENRANGWQIYGADFVTTDEGTGVVHIAPAFGEDDLTLGQAKNLPFIQHVALDGTFKPAVRDWPGLAVKPMENPQATDVEILKNLASRNLLFAKEKFTHSYPHCWRCDTPLLNYATSSWFIKVTALRDKLVTANQKINWVPDHVRDGRFGNWLEGARDWAISRLRFWGSPLPVWRCAGCQAVKIFGSFDELVSMGRQSNNRFWLMRHGQAESNIKDIISADPLESNHLTDLGEKEVKETAKKLAKEKINLIIASDFVRTKETAEIIAGELGLKPDQIILDARLREINPGNFTGQTWREYNQAFGSRLNRLHTKLSIGGENYNDVRRRAMSALYDFNQKYQDKNILIISHGLPLFMMQATVRRWTDKEIIQAPSRGGDFTLAEARSIDFVPLPHNRDYELDVHRPFIDEIVLPCACGQELKRVPEVFDCWYESGSMPYAQDHYPFKKDSPIDPPKKIGFPANFISEGLDQTRGWFYSLIVLGIALFGESPYQNVVANGLVLAADGQKMSKSLRNYPDPLAIANQFGADALRLYLMSSPAVRGEDLNFSEQGVIEISRRIVSRLLNVLSFYQLYAGKITPETQSRVNPKLGFGDGQLSNILDRWILARLNETIKQTTEALDRYAIDRSVWSLDDFISDLSTWYLRRSRDRFKTEGEAGQEAVATLRFVLLATAKLLAPVAPFVAEMIYQELKIETDSESVHLATWPDFSLLGTETLITDMQRVRDLVSLGLELRQTAGVKVRQPLATFIIKDDYLAGRTEYLELIKAELNVKTVDFRADLDDPVWLDPTITDDLRAEGLARELIRQIQDKRKTAGLAPGEPINLVIEIDNINRSFLDRYGAEIKSGTTTEQINYAVAEDSEIVWLGEQSVKVKIIKL